MGYMDVQREYGGCIGRLATGLEYDPNDEEREIRCRAYDELMAAGETEAASFILERPPWWEGGPVPPFRASDFGQ